MIKYILHLIGKRVNRQYRPALQYRPTSIWDGLDFSLAVGNGTLVDWSGMM